MTGLNRVGEGRLARFASGFALLFGIAALLHSSAADPPKKKPGADIFDAPSIVRINITIPASGMRTLQNYNWGNGGAERPEARVTVVDGTNTYKNVALHLKGSAGSFRSIDDYKPALTLNFDKFTPGQSFHGLQKISLNNSVQDPTFLAEKICREMYEAAGVPVPRADYAIVSLNGHKMGLYVLLEGYNKQFLKRYFKNVSGNLYDGGFCREITEDLNVNSGERPTDKSDLQRLASVAMAARQHNSLTELSKILDVDRFLSMVALEVIQVHWDGYTMNRNNYRVYHDMDSNRMVFMPHGMDQMFGTGGRGDNLQRTLIPPLNGIVSSAVLGTTEGRTRYLQRLTEIRTNVFKVDELNARVRQIGERIRPYSGNNGVEWLCQSITERARNLDELLTDLPTPANFTNGILRLTGWKPRNVNGVANFDLVSSKDGKKLLHVVANEGSSGSSWRTKAVLPIGQYRFEGYVRTRGAGLGNTGAHLRVSGTQSVPVLHGDNEWTLLNFTFEVFEPTRDVELVCELKGNKGEAWFDTNSLKIRQVQ